MHAPRIPIFSFRVRDGRGGFIHQQLVTRLLSDGHGVQARGGCACAGPYAHRLLDIDEEQSAGIWDAVRTGNEMEKPGWTRVNFHFAMSDAEADAIIGAVVDVAERADQLAPSYAAVTRSARFAFDAKLARAQRR
ncbi:hypothetical protein GCM10023264_11730 [Sphingomonas daechungensis]|uniref:Aminotransferase class V-fold PLP-dependent enzyme n=1 Tax=Sphingomonas daechungensis TaxID=1176646 RepID=A0ABX6SY96_9SPHN|nr:hypothetical protein [Sphingomonas daechungensis]QNP42395.1 hypothetical protein H9L15_08700 [Sphingomonas daechungensis]